MRFTYDGREFVGELPRGAAAIELCTQVNAGLCLVGCPAFTPDAEGVAILTVARQLSVARLRSLVLRTFDGWTLDGSPITEESFDELFAARPMEPWFAAMKVWVASRFFHVPVLSSGGESHGTS